VEAPIYLIIIGFLIGFPLIWMGVCKLILHGSGLYKIQKNFPARSHSLLNYSKLKIKSARMNGMNFNGVISVYLNREYLIIKVMKIFSFGFEGVQIPLSVIRFIKTGRQLFIQYSEFTIDKHKIRFYGNCEPIIENIAHVESDVF